VQSVQTKSVRQRNVDNSTEESRKRIGIEEREYNVTIEQEPGRQEYAHTFLSPRISELSSKRSAVSLKKLEPHSVQSFIKEM